MSLSMDQNIVLFVLRAFNYFFQLPDEFDDRAQLQRAEVLEEPVVDEIFVCINNERLPEILREAVLRDPVEFRRHYADRLSFVGSY